VTRIGTGISGITSTSPALSVATRTGVAAFSVYEEGKYDIYTLELGSGRPGASGRSGELAPVEVNAAVLPPIDRRPSEVVTLLHNAAFGLPAPVEYPSEDYKATLGLEGVVQPTVAVGADRFGAAIGGGLALQFSDMLGNHTLITAVQLSSGY